MAKVKIENLNDKLNRTKMLDSDEAEFVRGGATLEKLGDGQSVGDTRKTTVKGYGSTTGDGPSTF